MDTCIKHRFSRTTVGLLREHEVEFDSFDILSDMDVRQGLKTFSDWPTFPQLYAKGTLIGGLDILKEMVEDADDEPLVEQLGVGAGAAKALDDRLRALTSKAPIMLFMKGKPDAPECGFSRTIVGILQETLAATGGTFGHFDILTDPEVRQGLKTFSDWPTFPQLYVKGTLIGGLDIVKELMEDDELADTLAGE